MKYSIITFGCRVNQADSLEVEEELLAAGGIPSDVDCADVVVVNTCSVTATADQGARQTIRRIARQNPSARVVVTGCYATRQPQDLADLPGVVGIVANQQKEAVGSVVLSIVSGNESRVPTPESRVPNPESRVTTADRFGTGEG
ncbi:MAG: hypothetical protein ACRD1Q_17120, partial [Vicinamibacterales bacterium]